VCEMNDQPYLADKSSAMLQEMKRVSRKCPHHNATRRVGPVWIEPVGCSPKAERAGATTVSSRATFVSSGTQSDAAVTFDLLNSRVRYGPDLLSASAETVSISAELFAAAADDRRNIVNRSATGTHRHLAPPRNPGGREIPDKAVGGYPFLDTKRHPMLGSPIRGNLARQLRFTAPVLIREVYIQPARKRPGPVRLPHEKMQAPGCPAVGSPDELTIGWPGLWRRGDGAATIGPLPNGDFVTCRLRGSQIRADKGRRPRS
jgi:hypothetical protein